MERIGSVISQWALQSYMARLNYTLLDKFLLTLTTRIDGSSRLAEGNKYATFPSVALGWRVLDENANQRSVLSTASSCAARTERRATPRSIRTRRRGSGAHGLLVRRHGGLRLSSGHPAEPVAAWEKTATFDVGADFALLDGRISGTIDGYRATTNDLLMDRQLPPSTGYSLITQNVGETRNTGLEVALTAITLDGWHGIHWTNDVTLVEEQERDRLAERRPGRRSGQHLVHRPADQRRRQQRLVRLQVRRHLADVGRRAGGHVRPQARRDPDRGHQRRREVQRLGQGDSWQHVSDVDGEPELARRLSRLRPLVPGDHAPRLHGPQRPPARQHARRPVQRSGRGFLDAEQPEPDGTASRQEHREPGVRRRARLRGRLVPEDPQHHGRCERPGAPPSSALARKRRASTSRRRIPGCSRTRRCWTQRVRPVEVSPSSVRFFSAGASASNR